jgi:hypothetical protein
VPTYAGTVNESASEPSEVCEGGGSEVCEGGGCSSSGWGSACGWVSACGGMSATSTSAITQCDGDDDGADDREGNLCQDRPDCEGEELDMGSAIFNLALSEHKGRAEPSAKMDTEEDTCIYIYIYVYYPSARPQTCLSKNRCCGNNDCCNH